MRPFCLCSNENTLFVMQIMFALQSDNFDELSPAKNETDLFRIRFESLDLFEIRETLRFHS